MLYGALTRALLRRGVQVTYLTPRDPGALPEPGLRLVAAETTGDECTVLGVPSRLRSYASAADTRLGRWLAGAELPDRPLYGPELVAEVAAFAERAVEVVHTHGIDFDVIHAHDWTTFPAGEALRALSGRPLLAHVHITEFDKSGGTHADPVVHAIERRGMEVADRLLAVSRRVADRCVSHYGADAERTRVVYNGIDPAGPLPGPRALPGPMVLFLGRVTLQKGPEYFVEAARRVLDVDPSVTFVLAGTGDQLPRMIERAAELSLGPRMLFPGFVDREQAAALYAMADVFVMPSVSEPFGLVPLEAMDRGVPTIVSRQSGVSEVLENALKIDFWDVDDLAGKILVALRYPALRRTLWTNGRAEVARLNWDTVAERVLGHYREVTHA
jgi:glycosyltransferase involved in cell wall biosynthesis